jgi:tetratricopeptide (TPR) repeat protein
MTNWIKCPKCRAEVGVPDDSNSDVLCPRCQEPVLVANQDPVTLWNPRIKANSSLEEIATPSEASSTRTSRGIPQLLTFLLLSALTFCIVLYCMAPSIRRVPSPAAAERPKVQVSSEIDQLSEMSVLDDAIRKNPSSAVAFHDRGVAWLRRREFDKAIADLSQAIELAPDNPAAFSNRGYCLIQKKQYDNAIQDLTSSIQLAPRAATAYLNRGAAYLKKGDSGSAIADYSEAIRLDPYWPPPHFYAGCILLDMRSFDKAIDSFTHVLELDPTHILARLDRGFAWLKLREYDKAIDDATEVIRQEQGMAPAFQIRGLAYYSKRVFDKSVLDLSEGIRLRSHQDTDNPLGIWLDAQTLASTARILGARPEEKYRDGKQAILWASRACEIAEWKQPGYIETLAAAYAETGDFDRAVALQTKAIETCPDADSKERGRLVLRCFQDKKPLRDP